MRRTGFLVFTAALTLALATPLHAEEKEETADQSVEVGMDSGDPMSDGLTEEDREIVQILELLEMMDLLKDMEALSSMEDRT